MFEHHKAPLLPLRDFLGRMLRSLGLGLLILGFCLGVGMLGYHHFEGLVWVDAFVNAAMILSGMGPMALLKTDGGKLFAGCYALFSGVAFLTTVGITLAPAVHRFFHILHRERRDRVR